MTKFKENSYLPSSHISFEKSAEIDSTHSSTRIRGNSWFLSGQRNSSDISERSWKLERESKDTKDPKSPPLRLSSIHTARTFHLQRQPGRSLLWHTRRTCDMDVCISRKVERVDDRRVHFSRGRFGMSRQNLRSYTSSLYIVLFFWLNCERRDFDYSE